MIGRLPSRILFVADSSHAPDLAALVERAAGAGIRFAEIRRTESASSQARLDEIRSARARAPQVALLVNDRVDLAILAGAAGAHVGQDDLPASCARSLLGEAALLGLSTHDEAQLERAQDEPVDYVAIGPVFESPTKSGHAPVIGLQRLRALARLSRKPLVAIGGIDASNAQGVLDAGASAVAVASAIARGDVEENVTRLLAIAGEA